MVLSDERLKSALEQVVSEAVSEQTAAGGGTMSYAQHMARQVARANTLLTNMKAAISTTLIR